MAPREVQAPAQGAETGSVVPASTPGHENTDLAVSVKAQERRPNFRDDDGRLFLVRCFACAPEHGRENWALNVARGVCTWCGWTETTVAAS